MDMREVWKTELGYVFDIVKDIIENKGSNEVLTYASKFAEIESPSYFIGRSDRSSGNYIRVNYGEIYCYIPLDNDHHVKKLESIWWCNDEIGIDNHGTHLGTIVDLNSMSKDKANEIGYSFLYDEECAYEIVNELKYIKFGS